MQIKWRGKHYLIGFGARKRALEAKRSFYEGAVRIALDRPDPDSPVDWEKEMANLTSSVGKFSVFTDPMSARERIIVVTSLLDEMLRILLASKLKSALGIGRSPTNKEMRDVFTGQGPLATFGDRITVATMLGVMNADMRSDLRTMKGLRNEHAAHGFRPLSFDDEDIATEVQKLQLRMNIIVPDNTSANEARFLAAGLAVLAALSFSVYLLTEQSVVLAANADQIIQTATDKWRKVAEEKGVFPPRASPEETPAESPSDTSPHPVPE